MTTNANKGNSEYSDLSSFSQHMCESAASRILIPLGWMMATTGLYLSLAYINFFRLQSSFLQEHISRGIFFQLLRVGVLAAILTLAVYYLVDKTRRNTFFHGLSVFMILFWIMYSIRGIYAAYANETPYGDSFLSSFMYVSYQILVVLLLAVIASQGLPENLRKRTFFWIVAPAILLCLLYWSAFYANVLRGESGRSSLFYVQVTGSQDGGMMYFTPMTLGGPSVLSALLLFWAWDQKWMKTWVFIFVYFLTAVWLPFSATRTLAITYLIGHFSIILFSKNKFQRSFWIVLSILLIGNAVMYNYTLDGEELDVFK